MITNKVQTSMDTETLMNPFPGLRAFGVEESHLFFGREGQSEIILEYLAEKRFAAITGASGSGKSSLIYCGLVPVLFGGFVTGTGSNWRIVAARPGNQPVKNLSLCIAEAEGKENETEDIQMLREVVLAQMRRSSYGLVESVSQMGLGKGENLLLIIDQFEELFRYRENRDHTITVANETEAFIKLLVNAVRQKKIPIYVVLTMRSDFIGECSRFQELTKLINDSNFLVPQMTRKDFSRAITGPVTVAGAEIEPQLFQYVLNSISEDSDQLPVLQHAMMRTWEFWKKYNEPDTRLRLRDYEAAGKMENALSMHANEAYETLADEEKRVCKSMFKALTEKGPDNKGIRHPATINEIAAVAQTNTELIIKVADVFRSRGRSFITPSENIPLNPHTVIDISHESLMRVWDRLKGWVEEETNSVQMYMRLSEAASLFQRGKTGLWRPPDLQLALNWKKNQQPSLAWARKYNPAFEKVMVFLDSSEKKFIQEEQNKIKLQKRTLNRTRRFASIMAFTAIAFLGLMAFAIGQSREAKKQKENAELFATLMEQQKNVAVEEKDVKEIERLEALLEKDSADRARMSAMLQLREVEEVAYQRVDEATKQTEEYQKTTEQAQYEKQLAELKASQEREERAKAEQAITVEAEKRRLTVAQTMAIKSLQIEDRDLKALLACQSYLFNAQNNGQDNHPDIYQGLYKAYSAFMEKDHNLLKEHEGAVRSLAFIPSRNIFYSSGADGKILMWNLESPLTRPKYLIDNNFSNRSLALSSNGRWLACGTGTSTIQIFNLKRADGKPELKNGHRGSVLDLDFLPDKDILISVGSDKSILVWNLVTKEKRTIATHGSRIRAICTSKDGKYVYGGTDDGKLMRWHIQNGEAEILFDNKGISIYAVVLGAKGSRIALGDKTGNMIILNVSSGRKITQIKAHSSRILDMDYSPDNSQLATSSMDGTIKIWNTAKLSDRPVVITEHESWVFGIAFSPDGKTLVSSSESGEIYHFPGRSRYMAEKMCSLISRNLTQQEWYIYVGMDIGYQKTCKEKQ